MIEIKLDALKIDESNACAQTENAQIRFVANGRGVGVLIEQHGYYFDRNQVKQMLKMIDELDRIELAEKRRRKLLIKKMNKNA